MGRIVVSVIAFAGVVAFACDDLPVERPCTNIPPNGCPVANGISCADPSCAAIYVCRPGNVWELDRTCPNFDPNAGVRPVEDAGLEGGDADAAPSPDAPPGAYGGPGCGVLQAPDCSVGFALACGLGCCECEDLFVCREGAWDLWGACIDGAVRETPP